MAEAVLKSFAEKLNCGLCNQTLYKPKLLPCGHTYCQFCLDGIVTFNEVGKGTLICPMNSCKEVVSFTTKEVVATKLKNNITLENTLHVLNQHDQR